MFFMWYDFEIGLCIFKVVGRVRMCDGFLIGRVFWNVVLKYI